MLRTSYFASADANEAEIFNDTNSCLPVAPCGRNTYARFFASEPGFSRTNSEVGLYGSDCDRLVVHSNSKVQSTLVVAAVLMVAVFEGEEQDAEN